MEILGFEMTTLLGAGLIVVTIVIGYYTFWREEE
jgi:hypothetical protein